MTPILFSSDKELTIAIVRLNYVGLSLAVEFGKKVLDWAWTCPLTRWKT